MTAQIIEFPEPSPKRRRRRRAIGVVRRRRERLAAVETMKQVAAIVGVDRLPYQNDCELAEHVVGALCDCLEPLGIMLY